MGHIYPEPMRRLLGVPEGHDLPPLWDGETVQWGSWSHHETTIRFHVPAEQLACEQCGAIGESMISFGARAVAQPTPGWEHGALLRDLVAYRCRHCGHDRVQDRRDGTWWDLDASDYGDAGSTDEAPALFNLSPTVHNTVDK